MIVTRTMLKAYNKAVKLQAQYWDALGDFEKLCDREMDGLDSVELSEIASLEDLAEFIQTFDESEDFD